jgi:alkyl hydroperoxide reductase subunit AhpF
MGGGGAGGGAEAREKRLLAVLVVGAGGAGEGPAMVVAEEGFTAGGVDRKRVGGRSWLDVLRKLRVSACRGVFGRLEFPTLVP